ncbi:glutathione S-transferase T3-like protein [Tanacetum coccineum]
MFSMVTTLKDNLLRFIVVPIASSSVSASREGAICDVVLTKRCTQEAELEYRTIYNAPFTLTECWKILKDHPKWKNVKMPKFYKSKQSSSKKSRTSENTSQGNLDSAHIGVNLNDEAADSKDVEAQEVPAPIGRDRAKKKRIIIWCSFGNFNCRGRSPPLSIYELKSVNWNWNNGSARSKENWRD